MSVIAAVEALPTSGMTISALEALDFVVPGEWNNTTSFDKIAAEASGLSQPGVLRAIRERAAALEAADASYGRALTVYGLADTVDQLAAGAAVASKVSDLFGGLGFMDKFTPKPETTQSVDAGLKLVAELVAFGTLNGMPSTDADGLARFAGALADYGRYDLMRIAAWVVFDGLLPLGPEFVPKILTTFRSLASDQLTSNSVFQQVGSQLPGDNADEKRAFILKTIDTTGEWVTRFVEDKGLTQEKVMGQLKGVIDLGSGSMDYVAAAVDASTAYTTHTGTQTVARALAREATAQLKTEVWTNWATAQG